jgi:hypothetical protein
MLEYTLTKYSTREAIGATTFVPFGKTISRMNEQSVCRLCGPDQQRARSSADGRWRVVGATIGGIDSEMALPCRAVWRICPQHTSDLELGLGLYTNLGIFVIELWSGYP